MPGLPILRSGAAHDPRNGNDEYVKHKDQVRWVAKNDFPDQLKFVEDIFDLSIP
jgi:hypothetical protein